MIELTLNHMTCGHCEKVVRQTVQKLDPKARVDVDLVTKKVRIDSTRDAQSIRDALAEEGYPAT